MIYVEQTGKELINQNGSKINIFAKKENNHVIEIYTNELNKIDLKVIKKISEKNLFIHKKEIHLDYGLHKSPYLVLNGTTKTYKAKKQEYCYNEMEFEHISPIIVYTSHFKRIVKNRKIYTSLDYFCKFFINNSFKTKLKHGLISEKDFTFNISIQQDIIDVSFQLENPIGRIDLDTLHDLLDYFILTYGENYLDFEFLFFLEKKQGTFRFKVYDFKNKLVKKSSVLGKRKRGDGDDDDELKNNNKKIKY